VLGLGTTLVLMCLSGATVAGYALVKYGSIERVSGLGIDAAPAGEPENFLLVGNDTRDGLEGKRTDTIMVLRVEPEDGRASLLSFPRDLIVPIAGTGRTGMINAAFAMDAGEQVLIDTIRQNFAIPVHHYVEIDFRGFERLVDSLGGVPLWFDKAVRDRSSGFQVSELGCVTLSGDMALQFVRSRKLQYMAEGRWVSDPRSDLSRVERQQVFVKRAVAEALDQLKSSRNPTKLTSMIDIGVDNVRLDESLGVSDIYELAEQFQDVGADALEAHPLPVVDHPDNPNRVLVDERAAGPILNIFRGLDPGDINPDLVELTVMNGTNTDGLARDASGAFAAVGFDVQEPGNVPEAERPERTIVRHGPGGEDHGLRVVRHITGGAVLVENPWLEEHRVELVLGPDFTTVHDQPTPLDKLPDATAPDGSPGAADPATSDDAPSATPAALRYPSGPEAGAAGSQSGAETTTESPSGAGTTTTAPPPTTTTTRPPAIVGEPPNDRVC
jgi:polyisoprenyl-teichoic acid--peptidoglycan teichoic acid transferase